MTTTTRDQPAVEENQHFVPALHLRRWIATDLPRGANQGVWIVDIDKAAIDFAHPDDIASAYYFHEQQDAASRLPRIEPLLQRVEDRAARVLAAFEKDAPPDDSVNPQHLIQYIALQVARTPTGRRAMQAHIDAERAAGIVHPPEEKFFPRPRDRILAEFWDIARHLEKNPGTPDAALLSSLVRAVSDLAPKLSRAWSDPDGWLFLQAPLGYSYVTCDQPAAFLAHPGTSREEAHRGHGSTHIVFPHSPRNLLVICLDPQRCTALDIHAGPTVDEINDLMLFAADKQLFCTSRAQAERMLERVSHVRAFRKD